MRHDWFVTCTFKSGSWVGGEYHVVPASTAHAKQMGSTRTACGTSAESMAKLFETLFPTAGDVCGECADVVRADRLRRWQRTAVSRVAVS